MPVFAKSHLNHAIILLSLYISQPTIGLLLSRSGSLSRRGGLNLDGNQVLGRESTKLYLDLSDILDDDSTEFLEALKRQMEGTNILNASPREVTNRIKGFFVNNRRSPEEIVNFKKYIDANKSVMDVVNAVLLVEGCTRVNIYVKEIISWSSVLSAMEKPSPLLSSSMVYRGISCVRKMNSNDYDGQKFLKLLWERTQEAEVVLDESDICPAIYSMQSLNANSPITRNFLKFFADSVSSSREIFPSKTICSAVFGLKKMKSFPEVRYLIAALAKKIQSSDVFYHPVNICIALNGLQGMDDSSPEVRNLLTALMDKSISADEQGIDKATDREISMALFGLQRMGTKSTPLKAGGPSVPSSEVLKVIKYIGTLLDSYDQPFEGRRLGFAVMGISGMTSEVPEVQRLVGQLAMKAYDAWGDVSSQELSMCLHGLAGMKSESPNVRSLVKALIPLVKKCPKMTANDVRSAMYGLQGMHSNAKEVNELVESFADLYARSNVHFDTPYDASTALYSMQGLSSNVASSRRLMDLIADSMDGVKGKYEGRDISMSLYGLKEFSSECPETLKIVGKLTPYIQAFDGSLTVQNVAGTLQGMAKFRAGSKEVDELVGALAPHVGRAQGIFNSKGLSMALNGLQGLDSKTPQTRELIFNLATLVEKAELGFSGFEDFHQISFALSGLAGMSSEHSEVRKLLDTLSKLLKPLLAKNVEKDNVKDVKEVEGKRQWQQGKGVVILDEIIGGGSSPVEEKKKKGPERQEKKVVDKLAKMLRDAPKPEKVGMALFGLQGLSARQDSVRAIMDLLLPFVRTMPAPSGKALGMALQGFKSCAGKPPGSHSQILQQLSEKMSGWSTKKGGVKGANGKENGVVTVVDGVLFAAAGDIQVTFRSAIWGVSKMDRSAPSVQNVLKALAKEALMWDPKTLDKRTLTSIGEVYKGGGIEETDIVKALLLQTLPYMPLKKEMDPSKSKSNITLSSVSETNNRLDPSSSNKNIIAKIKPEPTTVTVPTAVKVNTPKTVKTNTPKSVKTNNNSTKINPNKINKPKIQSSQNVTIVTGNKVGMENKVGGENKVQKVKKQKQPQVPAAVVIGPDGVEVPKLSRRLKIQNKMEKKALREADPSYIPPTPVTFSTSTSTSSTPSTPTPTPTPKVDSNRKANRPLVGTASSEGPNSGKKWVRREQDVVSASPVMLSDSSLLAAPVGSSIEGWSAPLTEGAIADAMRIVATGILEE